MERNGGLGTKDRQKCKKKIRKKNARDCRKN